MGKKWTDSLLRAGIALFFALCATETVLAQSETADGSTQEVAEPEPLGHSRLSADSLQDDYDVYPAPGSVPLDALSDSIEQGEEEFSGCRGGDSASTVPMIHALAAAGVWILRRRRALD